MFCKSGILIFIFAENNHLVRQYIYCLIYAHTMLIKTHLLRQSLGPHVFIFFYSFFLSLSNSLFLANSLERGGPLSLPGLLRPSRGNTLCLHPPERAPGAYVQQREP